jgi:hypothetical protein
VINKAFQELNRKPPLVPQHSFHLGFLQRLVRIFEGSVTLPATTIMLSSVSRTK